MEPHNRVTGSRSACIEHDQFSDRNQGVEMQHHIHIVCTVRCDYFVVRTVRTVKHSLSSFFSLFTIAIMDEKIAQPRDENIAGPCKSLVIQIELKSVKKIFFHWSRKRETSQMYWQIHISWLAGNHPPNDLACLARYLQIHSFRGIHPFIDLADWLMSFSYFRVWWNCEREPPYNRHGW